MVVMVILWALLAIMIIVIVIVLVRMSIYVHALAMNIDGMMTLAKMAGIRPRQDAGIQPDQHAKTD